MAIPLDIDARRYYRVAYQRLEDGSLMLDKLDRPKAAIYLTGYAVECILKALILANTPTRARPNISRSFRGASGLDLSWLREVLGGRRVAVRPEIARALTYVASWSVDLRYEPGPGDREDAERFVAATRTIMEWAKRSM